ncbi:MAG: glycosyltransferase family 2 protein [Nitrospinae bacterium]|nr:glycosyltransferase family 2 protein [Nitrospinota bacterium]
MVSVIILTWNRKDDLIETITELLKSTYIYRNQDTPPSSPPLKRGGVGGMEIIVVDNGSDDGTDVAIRERFHNVIFKGLEKNIGIAGYNVGMKMAKGEYIVLLDSDSYPDRNAIERMVNIFESDCQIGVVAFDIHKPSAFSPQLSVSTKPFDLKKVRDIYGYNGAGVGIKRECLKKAGYLFEPYFLYFNEQDHAFRILNTGYKIKSHPEVVVYHRSSAISRPTSSAPYFYTRNLLWLIWRFYPIRYALISTIMLFFYASLSTLQQGTDIYIKAIFDAIKGFTMILSKREVIDTRIIKNARIPIRWAFTAYK